MAYRDPYQATQDAPNPFKPIDYAARLKKIQQPQEQSHTSSLRTGMPYGNRMSPARSLPGGSGVQSAVYVSSLQAIGSPAPQSGNTNRQYSVTSREASYNQAGVLNARSQASTGMASAPMIMPREAVYDPYPQDETPPQPVYVPEENPYAAKQLSLFEPMQRGMPYQPGAFASAYVQQPEAVQPSLVTDEISNFFNSAPPATQIPENVFASTRVEAQTPKPSYKPPEYVYPKQPVTPVINAYSAETFRKEEPRVRKPYVWETQQQAAPVQPTVPVQQPVQPPEATYVRSEPRRRFNPTPERVQAQTYPEVPNQAAYVPVQPQPPVVPSPHRRRHVPPESVQPQNYANNPDWPAYEFVPPEERQAPANASPDDSTQQMHGENNRRTKPVDMYAGEDEVTRKNEKDESTDKVKTARQQDKAEPRHGKLNPFKIAGMLFLVAVLGIVGMLGADYYHKLSGTTTADPAGQTIALLPAGQTYEPTVPVVTAVKATPSPTPIIDVYDPMRVTAEPGAEDFTSPQETPFSGRTKVSRYPKNEMLMLSDAVRTMRTDMGNNNIIGRLTIPGLLDEVVVQSNNVYYLTHDVHDNFSSSGAVFVDESCTLQTPPENLLLRGNSSVSGKVFGPLNTFATADGSYIATVRTAHLLTPYEEENYTLFAVIPSTADPSAANYFDYASHPTFASDAEMLSYVQKAASLSRFNFGVTVNPGDRLLTLATVSSDNTCVILIYRMMQ